ncbi:hypothetical protein [Pseudarthrobacter sp. LT1]|uniref:hypothetical protein n=1 Tax=Pseudarthrobacter sp. LT1 TaxID=3111450 RepID=UPI002D77EBF0|nr:hypothetical protein [Pseudarthrobacter sp. LT1]WRT12493.1 hypothetical protein VIK36_14105 [Pseudarthrobacter sp. LT1]
MITEPLNPESHPQTRLGRQIGSQSLSNRIRRTGSGGGSKEPVVYDYVDLDHMSRYLLAATIAHEDHELGPRAGAFSWEDFKARAEAHLRGEGDPSGSTISQLWKDLERRERLL